MQTLLYTIYLKGDQQINMCRQTDEYGTFYFVVCYTDDFKCSVGNEILYCIPDISADSLDALITVVDEHIAEKEYIKLVEHWNTDYTLS